MKKKLFKILMVFIAVLFTGVIIQSCCRDKEEHKICNLSLRINNYGDNDSLTRFNMNSEDNIDTSYNHFDYYLNGQTSPIGDVCMRRFFIITSAYAMQPCLPNIIDSIPRNNIDLSLDRDINYNGTIISAGTNLIKSPILSNVLEYDYYNDYAFEGRIKIDETNLTKLQFDTGYYKLTLIANPIIGEAQTFEKKILFKKY